MRQRKQRTAQQRTKQQKKHKTIDYTLRGLDIAMIKNVAISRPRQEAPGKIPWCFPLLLIGVRKMKFVIKHEIKGRMRIHVSQYRMSYEQADTLLYFLHSNKYVTFAKVYERTGDAVISYVGDRTEMIRTLQQFSYEKVDVPAGVVENSGRELNAKYQEKQKVIKKLSAKKRIFIHMMETLSRGLGEVLYAEGKNVLIYLPEIGNAMLNAEDEEHLEKMLPLIPKAVSGHSIVTVTDRWNERVSEILGYHGSMLCSQACYTRGEPLPVRHKDIRQLTVEEVPYVAEHYHLGDEIYVRERIAAGDVFGIYIEGKLCGFIGCHNDGSMGMLYVEDAYRRQGLAASLEGYLINKQREQGMIPYAHIVNGNEASIQLQERLGLNLSDPAIWWLYN